MSESLRFQEMINGGNCRACGKAALWGGELCVPCWRSSPRGQAAIAETERLNNQTDAEWLAEQEAAKCAR